MTHMSYDTDKEVTQIHKKVTQIGKHKRLKAQKMNEHTCLD